MCVLIDGGGTVAPWNCGSATTATFGKLGPSDQGFLHDLADLACSTGVVDRSLRLRIAMQHLSCALGAWHCSAIIIGVLPEVQLQSTRAHGKEFFM